MIGQSEYYSQIIDDIKWDMFKKRYSKLVPETLLKIGHTNVTQNWLHKCHSKLVPQTLLKTGYTNISQN